MDQQQLNHAIRRKIESLVVPDSGTAGTGATLDVDAAQLKALSFLLPTQFAQACHLVDLRAVHVATMSSREGQADVDDRSSELFVFTRDKQLAKHASAARASSSAPEPAARDYVDTDRVNVVSLHTYTCQCARFQRENMRHRHGDTVALDKLCEHLIAALIWYWNRDKIHAEIVNFTRFQDLNDWLTFTQSILALSYT